MSSSKAEKTWKFEGLLKGKQWISPAYVQTDSNNKILSIQSTPPEEKIDEEVSGHLLPGFKNTHSHAFQYAMAGLAEKINDNGVQDNFWTWREEMYSLALKIDPDQMEALATFLYAEMVKSGYTHVTEFHYVHHDPEGKVYSNPAEMSLRLMNAAKKSKINLTLVPIFYQKGGFNKEPLPQQRRFLLKSSDEYQKFLQFVSHYGKQFSHVTIGHGVHSLRAVSTEDLLETHKFCPEKTPFHLHIAEQVKEVEECQQVLGARPVQWLLDNVDINEYTNLVHSTHINESELKGIVERQSNVVICPSTEANLGDGYFPLKKFAELKGHWSIGSDSHIGLCPMEELRWLEYGERLKTLQRNPLCQMAHESSGDILYHQSQLGSQFALGENESQSLKEGNHLTGIVLNSYHPLFYGKAKEGLLSSLIFSGKSTHLLGVLSQGEWVVIEGNHKFKQPILKDFMRHMPVI